MALRSAPLLHQKRGNRLQTAPVTEPVTLAELKTHLRISGTDDDEYLTGLISEARQELEDATGFAFITQTWQLTIDRWPSGREQWWDGVRDGAISNIHAVGALSSVTIPRYPLISVGSVTVYDEDSNATPITVSTTFDVDAQQMPGRVTIKNGATWPAAFRANNAIEIVYIAGYGDAADVPGPIKAAIRNMAAFMYAHRGDGCAPEDAYDGSGARAIMARYRVRSV